MVLHRFDAFQRRHRGLGVPFAVLYKFLDDQGVYLAVVIAFYAFLSIFPLFLLLSSVLGFVLAGQEGLQDAIIATATELLPVLGEQIQRRGLSGSPLSITLGIVGALYGGLGVASAVQNALNTVWNVPRGRRPNPVMLRLKGIVLIIMIGAFVVATTILSQLTTAFDAFGTPLGPWSKILATGGALLMSVGLFVLLTRFGVAHDVRHRTMLPGAVLAALLWQLLQTGGGALIGYYASRAPVTEGVFGVVVGLLLWMFLATVALVLCFEVNAVLARRLYPRSVVAPLTEDAELTPADRSAYANLARMQALKSFENVDVTFDRADEDSDDLRTGAEPSKRPRRTGAHVADGHGRPRDRTRR